MPSQPLYSNESDLKVLRQRFLLRKFFSTPCYPLFKKGSFLFCIWTVSEIFSQWKLFWPLMTNIVFLLLLLQAIVIIMGIALINAKTKSVIVFAIILFSWGLEGDTLEINNMIQSMEVFRFFRKKQIKVSKKLKKSVFLTRTNSVFSPKTRIFPENQIFVFRNHYNSGFSMVMYYRFRKYLGFSSRNQLRFSNT